MRQNMGAVFGKCLGQGKDKNGEQQQYIKPIGIDNFSKTQYNEIEINPEYFNEDYGKRFLQQ